MKMKPQISKHERYILTVIGNINF